MSTTTYAWAPITKVEDQADGTVMVYGPAADAGVDRDKQRLNQQWLDAALPEWLASGGNVREQHDALRAVGRGVGLTRGADGAHMLAAHVVDPVAVSKVQAKVLQGFSIRIKDPRVEFGKADAPNGEIVGGTIPEVSLVDRPSNPRTYFTMVKSDEGGQLTLVEDPEVIEVDPADQGEAILDELGTLLPNLELVKADTAATDVATAQQAIALVGKLIASEARSLAAGQLSDECDISSLLDAVRALKYFISRESAEQEQETGEPVMVAADAVKTDTATASTPPEVPDLAKVEAPDFAAIVKAAVAEATTLLRDELALVKADVAKAVAMPELGGPVAMRTASQAVAARAADAITLRAQASTFLVKAEQCAREDPALAAGYRERAAELTSKADA